jgi:DNA-binding response OmpR family regulator
VRDRLSGYESGADIYLTKPTSADELCAAVQALTRRIRPDDAAAHVHALTLHLDTMTLHGPAERVQLSGHEAILLAAFVRAKDHLLETWQIIALAHKEVNEASKKALEVQIVRLRRKLLQAGAQEPTIKSIRGQGYRLCQKVSLSEG